MKSRRLAVRRLYWHRDLEAFEAFFLSEGVRPPPYPEPYPEPCFRWWRAAS